MGSSSIVELLVSDAALWVMIGTIRSFGVCDCDCDCDCDCVGA